MILVGFLVLILAITTMIRISIFDYFQGISILFHNFCLVRLNFDFLSQAELQALVCGKNFSNFETANLYMASGLIHLFVVSGAHLLIIENFIVKFFSRNHITTAYFIIIILSIYALACKLNPPITRSLISVMVSMTIIRNHLRWPENFKIFVCGAAGFII